MLSQTTVGELKADFLNRLQTKTSGRRSRRWACNVSEMLVGEYLIMPLTSAKMLKSEGYCMNNCCRDYVEKCAGGNYRVFSIRNRSGERLATLGVKRKNEYWQFDQCFGPYNREVLEEVMEYLDEDGKLHVEWSPTEIYYIAHEVIRLMNSATHSH